MNLHGGNTNPSVNAPVSLAWTRTINIGHCISSYRITNSQYPVITVQIKIIGSKTPQLPLYSSQCSTRFYSRTINFVKILSPTSTMPPHQVQLHLVNPLTKTISKTGFGLLIWQNMVWKIVVVYNTTNSTIFQRCFHEARSLSYGLQWFTIAILMVYNGLQSSFLWFTMVYNRHSYGLPWFTIVILMVYYGLQSSFLWFNTVYNRHSYGLPWFTIVILMVYYGLQSSFLWFTMVYNRHSYGLLWFTIVILMVYYGLQSSFLWFTMVYNRHSYGLPWFTIVILMVYHGLQSSTTYNPDIILMVYYGLQSSTTYNPDIILMVYNGLQSSTTYNQDIILMVYYGLQSSPTYNPDFILMVYYGLQSSFLWFTIVYNIQDSHCKKRTVSTLPLHNVAYLYRMNWIPWLNSLPYNLSSML